MDESRCVQWRGLKTLLALAPGAERSRCGLVGSPGAPETVQMECRRFRRSSQCPNGRPAHGWVKTVGAGACRQRCFRSVLRWGFSHRMAPPWVDALRIALPAAADNRRFHALPRRACRSSVVDLGCCSEDQPHLPREGCLPHASPGGRAPDAIPASTVNRASAEDREQQLDQRKPQQAKPAEQRNGFRHRGIRCLHGLKGFFGFCPGPTSFVVHRVPAGLTS